METTQQASEPPIKARDFGEPWKATAVSRIEDRDGYWQADTRNNDQRDHIIACVNACTGMADPAREIARLKNCSDELDSILSVIPEDAPCLHAETGETVADYILGMQKEVGRVHALYFNTSQQLQAQEEEAESQLKIYKQELEKLGRENAAMRDAIKEAHTIIERYSESAISHSAMLMCPECLRIEAFNEEHKDTCSIGNALAKLQPFLPKP